MVPYKEFSIFILFILFGSDDVAIKDKINFFKESELHAIPSNISSKYIFLIKMGGLSNGF